MIYIVKINDKEYEVEVEKGRANILKTTNISPAVMQTPIETPVVATADKPSAEPSITIQSGTTSVKSPLPGTVLDIKVVPGQTIKKGEILLIIEAMKMENEIAAPADGVVAQVLVNKGASVDTNDVLISIQ